MECSHANSHSGGVLKQNLWFILHKPLYISSVTISQEKLKNKHQLHESKELRKREFLLACNLSAAWTQAVTHSQELPSSSLPSGKKRTGPQLKTCAWVEMRMTWDGKGNASLFESQSSHMFTDTCQRKPHAKMPGLERVN